MRSSASVLLLTLSIPACLAAKDKPQAQDPVVWGDTGQNAGCVIFAEGSMNSTALRPTGDPNGGQIAVVQVTGKLTLIESIHYTMDQKVIVETPANMDALMQRAHRDRLKYVKIPGKYSPEQFQTARALCAPATGN